MRFCRRLSTCMMATAIGGLALVAANAQTTVNFSSSSPVDLGTNLPKLADLDPWSYTLGTEWDERFRIGGIIGAPNTTVIPEVKILGATIIPEVKADTRTGAQMQGRVWGDVGLEFSADFIASGLESGVGFDFAPTLSYEAPEAGSFFQLATTVGTVNNGSFTEAALELPAVDAQVDFFFNLDMSSSIDYGLFPFIPYDSVPFTPGGIHLDQRNDDNKSLVRFQASLDPDDNNGDPLPPRLTFLEGVEVLGVPLETQVGLLDNGQFLANKQISFQIEDKDNPSFKPRIDVGEVQVLNPFGTGGDLLGGNNDRNLQVETSVSGDSIGYSFETPLFRLGLDLDGIAAGLAVGHSFTRLEEDIMIGETKVGEIAADFIDLKYGPELGFRESVEINPDFDVTLNFQNPDDGTPVEVAINDNGSVSLMSTFAGQWNDLPDIALLTPEAVDVAVSFDSLSGEQSKRGAFYLSDYLEFTLLELEKLNILDVAEFSLPPLFRTRTSLLGNLLGQLELEAYTDSASIAPFALNGTLPTTSFTITPTPSMLAYLTEGGEFNPDFNSVRRLSDHSPASFGQLADLTIVIGAGDTASMSVGDFTPLDVTDPGHVIETDQLMVEQGLINEGDPVLTQEYSDPRQETPVMGLQLVAGSTYTQSGSRTWKTATIINDGLYTSTGEMTRFSMPGGTMLISGGGQIEVEQRGRIDATVVVHGAGHTLRFDTATGFTTQEGPRETIQIDPPGSSPPRPISIQLPDEVIDAPRIIDAANIFINAGTLDFFGSSGELFAGMEFDNASSGRIDVVGDGGAAAVEVITMTTPDFTNSGAVTVGPGSRMDFQHPDSNLALQFRGDGSFRVDGGTARFLTNVSAYAPDEAEIPEAVAQTFEVFSGGTLEFQGNTLFFAKPTFHVDAESELIFNGLGLDGTDGFNSKFAEGAPIEVVNEGQLTFNSGSNHFQLATLGFGGTQEPTVIPIGLENSGTVTIQNTARLSVDAEIRDYAEGGATFDAGTWEIIGPTPNELYNNLTSNDLNVARFNFHVSQVEVGDNFLTVIDPGLPGGAIGGFGEAYDATEYDTFLAVNRSDITLSGRAKFEYLNTLQTNAGRLALDNMNHFTTAGELTNSGTIELTRGSRLEVAGDLLVEGGIVNVDETSTLTVGSHAIEVIGGTVFVERSAGTALVNTRWIVRDQNLLDDEGNVIGIAPGIVDYGETVFPTIGPNAEITIAGAEAEFRPLAGLELIEGSLTLDANHSFTLSQALQTAAGGELHIIGGANFVLNSNLNHHGRLTVGEKSFAKVVGAFLTTAGSTTEVDGVLESAQVNISSGSTLTGSGQISGNIFVEGTLMPGNSTGTLQSFRQYTQATGGNFHVELLGVEAGEEHDQLLADSAVLAGTLTIGETDPALVATVYGQPLEIVLTENGVTGQFDAVVGDIIDDAHRWVVLYEPSRVSVTAALNGDANFNGTIEQGDLDAVLLNWGSNDANWTTGDYDNNARVDQADLDFVLLGWGNRTVGLNAQAVPEPSTIGIAVLAVLLLLLRPLFSAATPAAGHFNQD